MSRFPTAFLALISSTIFAVDGLGADFTVTNTSATGPGSLAQAINDANNSPGPDRIVFSIPNGGVHRINLTTSLPSVTDTVVIDGYTQPGASPNTLQVGDNAIILIQVDGGASTDMPVNGFVIQAPNCAVRGLSITGFGYAVSTFSTATGLTIEGNFIGLLPDGITGRGNGTGVSSFAINARIGGDTAAARNVISGQTNNGIFINDHDAIVEGNYIGTDASGTKAIGNQAQTGIYAYGNLYNTIIGGTTPGKGNLISGNGTAILMGAVSGPIGTLPPHGLPTNGVTISGNLIGVQADRITPLGNLAAINILYGDGNTIGGSEPGTGNIIANYGTGITISVPYSSGNPTAERNRILSNTISFNGVSLPIDLGTDGRTENDAGDADTGPNGLQNYPIILSRAITGGTTTVAGTLNSKPNSTYTIQLFGDAPNKPQIYVGETNIVTDVNGNAAFAMTTAIADPSMKFSGTATDSTGNTSESSGDPARLKNISTRAKVQPGDDALIAGFIVREGGSHLVVRAIGPSMFGQQTPDSSLLADPVLELYDSAGLRIAQNDNWKDDPAAAAMLQQEKLAPSSDSESAIDIQLPGGQYTAVVRGKNNGSGLALVEVYQLSEALAGEVGNLSSRGRVGLNDEVMIAGLISGEANQTNLTLVRALGPSLSASGVANPLSDPTLELHDGNGLTIAVNDNWKEKETQVRATGLAPSQDAESAIVMRLRPGVYTAVVRGKAGSTGIALVEVYNLH